MEVVKDSFKIHLIIMKILGLYPVGEIDLCFRLYSLIVHLVFVVPVPALAIIYLCTDETVDLDKIVDNGFIALQSGVLIIKLWPLKSRVEEVQATIYALESKYFSSFTDHHEKIVQESIRTCRHMCVFFLVFSNAALLLWGLKPLSLPQRALPLDIWLPFNGTGSPSVYYPTYVFIVLGVAQGAFANSTVDTLIVGLIVHGTGQVQVLKDKLEHICRWAKDKAATDIPMDVRKDKPLIEHYLYEHLLDCIKHHDSILLFIDKLQDTYSNVIFSQFSISMLVICMSCFKLTIVDPLSLQFFAMIFFVFTMLVEIYIYCYYGTLLHEESKTLATSLYMSNWHDFDVKSRKALILFMERCKRPMIIRAGKMFDLSLPTFTMILRKAYSLMAVLQQN